ncbi:hypothetical protein DL764_008294 [Monosporascus ibericus]|uniref:Uncharacterized protein n=1 Tax=Monosporascus ibericus TaxID=155417 RepID=A0A4Q4SXV7_9PEZI|nr:hypothetical protein DL764_008294 [Monosporascus ibericus]
MGLASQRDVGLASMNMSPNAKQLALSAFSASMAVRGVVAAVEPQITPPPLMAKRDLENIGISTATVPEESSDYFIGVVDIFGAETSYSCQNECLTASVYYGEPPRVASSRSINTDPTGTPTYFVECFRTPDLLFRESEDSGDDSSSSSDSSSEEGASGDGEGGGEGSASGRIVGAPGGAMVVAAGAVAFGLGILLIV